MNKTILVTGSSRGIGKAIAKLAYEKGYRIVLHGRKDSSDLQKLQSKLSGSIAVHFDVADKAATKKAVTELLKQVETIDVLVNNAGIGYSGFKDVADIDDDKAIEEYKVNVLGTLHCIQAVLPAMISKGAGSIVNVASIKAHTELSTMSSLSYGSTKAGVISITKALAKTYPKIRFNSVSPGYVETDMAKLWSPETFQKIDGGTVLGRIAKPEEIAPLVLFLASDEASYITGSDYLVDGGYAIQGK